MKSFVGSMQVFLCNTPNPTVTQLPAVGQNLKFYTSPTGGTPVSSSAVLPLNTYLTYYVSQTVNGCESERVPATYIILNQDIPTPIAESVQTFYCSNPTVADLQVDNPQNAVWWDSQTSGNSYFGGEQLVNNQLYYVENKSYSPYTCSSVRVQVQAVKSSATPPAYTVPFTESFNKSFCALGYSSGSAASSGSIADNVLKIPNLNANVNDDHATTKRISLNAGVTYYISFKVKKMIANQNSTLTTSILSTSSYLDLGTFATSSVNYSVVNYSVTPTVSGYYYLKFSTSSVTSDGVLIDDLKVSTSQLGVDEIKEEDIFNIYPNPTSGIIIIESKDTIKSLVLYDMQGRLLKTEKVIGRKYQINLYALPKGVYLLKINSEAETKSIEVIKN